MNNKNCFIYVTEKSPYNSMLDTLLTDVLNKDNVVRYEESWLNSAWKRLVASRKGQKLLPGFVGRLLYKDFKWIEDLRFYSKQYEKVFVFFWDTSFVFHRPPAELFKVCKNKYKNVYFILFYIDMVSRPVSRISNILRSRGVFDLIYTFDKQDAKKYGMRLRYTPYSVPDKIISDEASVKWDLYYCAALKERKRTILEILNAGIPRCNIHMDLVANNQSDDPDFINKSFQEIVSFRKKGENIPYQEMLQKIKCSNCILDIAIENQVGVTLRPYEAVVFQKKLLTNNPNVTKFPFYDARYMKYFRSTDEIDWDWVCKKEVLKYNYNNDFSPVYLFDDIESYFANIVN